VIQHGGRTASLDASAHLHTCDPALPVIASRNFLGFSASRRPCVSPQIKLKLSIHVAVRCPRKQLVVVVAAGAGLSRKPVLLGLKRSMRCLAIGERCGYVRCMNRACWSVGCCGERHGDRELHFACPTKPSLCKITITAARTSIKAPCK
jgi:hypothetical protein